MKKNGTFGIAFAACLLLGCTSNNSTSTPNSNQTPPYIEEDYSIGQKINPAFELPERRFVDFPSMSVGTSALTYDLSADETYYIVSDRAHTLSTPNVVIPEQYNNLPVKEIAAEGFVEKLWLESIYIPKTITKIGDGAFSGSGLKTVYYDAASVADFNARNWVFYPNADVQNIDIIFGPHVERIPNRLFYPLATNPSLIPIVHSIAFARNSIITEIGDYAFYGLSDITSVSLPDTIEKIGDYAFQKSGITSLELPLNLQIVGERAFTFNSKLERIVFKENIEEIKEGAFYGCSKLLEVDLSSTKLTCIAEQTFKNCPSLNRIIFNETIEIIDNQAFANNGLVGLVLPLSLLTIGDYAFADSKELVGLSLNASLSHIGDYAFSDAAKVEKLIINSVHLANFSPNNNVFTNLGHDASRLLVALGNQVEYLPERLFFPSAEADKGPAIDKLVMHKSITSIGAHAFFNLSIDQVDYVGTKAEFMRIAIADYNDGLKTVAYCA